MQGHSLGENVGGARSRGRPWYRPLRDEDETGRIAPRPEPSGEGTPVGGSGVVLRRIGVGPRSGRSQRRRLTATVRIEEASCPMSTVCAVDATCSRPPTGQASNTALTAMRSCRAHPARGSPPPASGHDGGRALKRRAPIAVRVFAMRAADQPRHAEEVERAIRRQLYGAPRSGVLSVTRLGACLPRPQPERPAARKR